MKTVPAATPAISALLLAACSGDPGSRPRGTATTHDDDGLAWTELTHQMKPRRRP